MATTCALFESGKLTCKFLPLILLLCSLGFFPIPKSIQAGHFDKVPLLLRVLRTIPQPIFRRDSSKVSDNPPNIFQVPSFQSTIYTIQALFLSKILRVTVPTLLPFATDDTNFSTSSMQIDSITTNGLSDYSLGNIDISKNWTNLTSTEPLISELTFSEN